MIILHLFLYFVSQMTINEAIDLSSKPMMCAFHGSKVGTKSRLLPDLNPSDLPLQCSIILFTDCQTNPTFSCNTATLKALVESNFTVILKVYREKEGWSSVLKPDGNAADAKAITDYATKNGAKGVLLDGFALRTTKGTPDGILAANVIPYFKQLKFNQDFLIGVSLDPFSYILLNPNVFNYGASNALINFYLINTYRLNGCHYMLFNGDSPIFSNDLVSLENVVTTINETNMDMAKVYFVIDLLVDDPNSQDLKSYYELCQTTDIIDEWCAPTTLDYHNKAQFMTQHGYGIAIFWIEFDDIQESCECGRFIGLQNILAGVQGRDTISCDLFDMKFYS